MFKTMKITLKSKKLVQIRKELKKEMVLFGEQQKGLIDLNKEHKKTAVKIDRIKVKGMKELSNVLKEQHKMDEFDYFVNYEAIDNEKLECEIANIYEDTMKDKETLKQKLREDRKNKEGMWGDETMFIGHND